MTANHPIPAPDDSGEFLLYQTEDGRTRLEVRMAHESMAELFQKDVSRTINDHIRNIFEEGKVREEALIRHSRISPGEINRAAKAMHCLFLEVIHGY